MASPSSDPIPFAGSAAHMYADIRGSSDSDSDSGSGSDDSDDDSSAFTVADLDRTRNICRWRSPQFHDRECDRFFDCPSHIVERSLSDAGSVHEHEHDDPEPDVHVGSSRSSRHDRSSSSEESAHDVDAHSPRPSHDASTSPGSTHAIEQPVPPLNPNPTTDSIDIISALEALRMTPPETQPGTSPYTTARHEHEPRSQHPPAAGEAEAEAATGEQVLSGLPEPRRERTPVSRERMDAPLPSPRRRQLSESLPPLPQPPRGEAEPAIPAEWTLPRWQSDAEVTYCPICHNQFSFFVRKHHCRKCGRVVCHACSPHRIIIPYQYIVRPPGSELPQALLVEGLSAGYFNVGSVSGGERVRLCNPCVPDPNTAPPQSPNSSAALSPRPAHTRSRSSAGAALRALPGSNRHGAVFAPGTGNEPYQYLRTRSITVGTQGTNSSHGSSSRRPRVGTHQTPIARAMSAGSSSSSYPHRYSSLLDVGSSSRQRALPPTPQLAEEDECPICHRELPSQSLPNHEALRESHITTCIQSHSTYGTPRQGDTSLAAPRRTGMYTYPATEKDCIDDAECTICLEEFTVGIPMARLECLCRFHRSCISAWFVNHPGRCPVHQHDGFGY